MGHRIPVPQLGVKGRRAWCRGYHYGTMACTLFGDEVTHPIRDDLELLQYNRVTTGLAFAIVTNTSKEMEDFTKVGTILPIPTWKGKRQFSVPPPAASFCSGVPRSSAPRQNHKQLACSLPRALQTGPR